MNTIVSIDGVGRIVLPKKVREQLNLHPGSRLELSTRGDGVELRPVDTTPALVREDGLWVHHGTATTPLGDAVRRARDDRAGQLGRPANR